MLWGLAPMQTVRERATALVQFHRQGIKRRPINFRWGRHLALIFGVGWWLRFLLTAATAGAEQYAWNGKSYHYLPGGQ